MICGDDADEDGEEGGGDPPADGVADEVDLLAGSILRPERHTAKQERPLDGLGSVRVRGGESVVVVEHRALELEVFLPERHGLDLAGLFVCAGILGREGGNVLDEPDVGGLGDVLVAVDFGLVVGPVGETFGVCPHGDTGRGVDDFHEGGECAELGLGFTLFEAKLEDGVVVAGGGGELGGGDGEFLVGGKLRGGDVVGDEDAVGSHMVELDAGVVLDGLLGALIFGERVLRENNPVVIGVLVVVAGNLLA